MEARLVTKAGYNFTPVEMAGFPAPYLDTEHRAQREGGVSVLLRGKARRPEDTQGIPAGYRYRHRRIRHRDGAQSGGGSRDKDRHPREQLLPGHGDENAREEGRQGAAGNCDAEKYLSSTEHCVVTGNPLRSNIKIEERSAARKRLGLRISSRYSRLAEASEHNGITEAVAELIAWEEKTGGINHIHSYGGKGKELFYSALEQSGAHEDKSKHIFRDYIDNMYTCMCAADLIISRAGAMTITELMAIGRPAVLVPYPNAAENHQYYNALTLSNAHAAILIEDKDLTKARLVEEVSALYNDRGRLALMEENSRRSAKNDAADRILGEIIDLLGKEKFENQGSTD